jgi:penicillin-binding protein 2
MVGGKTGTAQVVRLKQYIHLKEEDIPYKYRDHALFICFAPAENPEIVVAVVVEHGLHGGSAAAPVARAVLEKYFAGKYALEEIDTVVVPQRMLEGDSPLLVNDIAGDILRQQTQVIQ